MTSGYVQWNQVGTNGSKAEFLRLKGGVTCRVRPLKQPICFRKFYFKKNGKTRSAIVDDNIVDQMMKEYQGELKNPPYRFVMYVIDREDGKIKIMEFPMSVYNGLRERFEATGKKPGSAKDGGDYRIKVTGTGLATKYMVTYIEETPLTTEERDLFLKVSGEADGESKLDKIYKFCSKEEAEKKLFSDEENAGNSSDEVVVPDEDVSEVSSDENGFNW